MVFNERRSIIFLGQNYSLFLRCIIIAKRLINKRGVNVV